MIIKYRCWDKVSKRWRTPNPERMVSMFVPGTRNAMRIVATDQYSFFVWTGSEDIHGNDVYPGDILDDQYYVNWDILNGRWAVYERGTEQFKYTFSEYKPHEHEITSNTFDEKSGEHIS